MNLDFEVVGDVLVVAPRHKRLDASVADSLKQRLRNFVEQGHSKLVLDLEKVQFMDSSGLTVIISTLKALDNREGELVVCGVNDNLGSLFHLTRLDRVFRIFPDSALASQALQG